MVILEHKVDHYTAAAACISSVGAYAARMARADGGRHLPGSPVGVRDDADET
jgi:hypothetical protein